MTASAAADESGTTYLIGSGDARAVADRLADDFGVTADHVYTAVGQLSAELTPGQAEAVSGWPSVTDIGADTELELTVIGDPDVVPMPFTTASVSTAYSWGLDRIDQANLPLDGLYRYDSRAGAGVRVYVIDTGVAQNPYFGGRVATGYDGVGDGRGTGDCVGHGTHVAGTVAAAYFGVARQVTIVPVRVQGCEEGTSSEDIVAATDWILTHHPAGSPGLVNISMGGPHNEPVNAAMEALVAAGLPVVASAGNENGDACDVSPASAPNVITVAATGQDDSRASYSNWGSCVDVFAPGNSIHSLYLDDTDYYMIMSGTSMASPHVAGIAALYLAQMPDATVGEVTAEILSAAHPVVTDSQSPTTSLASSSVLPIPQAVDHVDLADVTQTSVYASWPPVSNPSPSGYEVNLVSESDVRQVYTSSTGITLGGLFPDTSYSVEVASYNDTGKANATVTEFQTPEATTWFAQVIASTDLTGDTQADILAIGYDGVAWLYPGRGDGRFSSGRLIGRGWAPMRAYAPGDWNGDGRSDLMAVDLSGVLWLYAGNGRGGFSARVEVGHGWTSYRITPAGDVDGNGTADLLAIDSSQRLWLYPGRGSGGFYPRRQVGWGWSGFDLYAAGDQNGDGRVDILGLDQAGQLWFYAGRGDGRFAPRVQVGRGWGTFLFASGADFNGDGYGDLLGRAPDRSLYFYPGRTGGGFLQRVKVGTGW